MTDNVQLIAAIDAAAEYAYGTETDNGELSTERSLALDAYAGKNIEPAPEGRSQVTDWSVFETVQWILPSLTRIFAGGDTIVEFDPTGPEDEDVAAQESKYLNYLVTQKNNWFLTCLTWFQDALITKNAYCMAVMEEKIIPEVEMYESQREEQVAMILDDDVEVLEQRQFDDPDDEGKLIDPANGQPIDPQDQETMLGALAIYQSQGQEPQLQKRQLFDIKVRKTKAVNKLQFQVLPPERVLVGEDTPDFTLEDCNYFEYWELMTLSDIRKLGFEIEDDISDDPFSDTPEDVSRDENLGSNRFKETPDPSMRQVKVRNIWIRFDDDEDGIAELLKIVRVGRKLLSGPEIDEIQSASRIPVACIVPFLHTHRHMGASVADLIFDIQRIKTSLLRNGLDSLNLSLRPRHAISDKVNLDDMLISRAGGVVRLRDGAIPGEGHVLPLVTEPTFQQAQMGLQHMDTVIESRAGVNRQFQGMDPSANNDFNRIGQLTTMASQRVEQIARLFANGVERLFSVAHELIIKSGHSEETIKLSGQWVTIDPTQWRTGRDMKVVAPFAAGNKDSLLQRLMMVASIQEKALAGGLPITDANDAYELALEISAAADLQGTKFFTDPSTVEPKEPPPDYTMMALEVENKKADTQASDSQIDAQVKTTEIQTEAEVRQFVARLQSETQIALANIKAGNSVDLEQFKANLKNAPIELGNETIAAQSQAMAALNAQVASSIQEVTEAISELKDASSADKEVVRENGKVVGVRSNGRMKKVKRDKDGRITGL